MPQIQLSDPAYAAARQAASRSGRSVEAFVEEAVRLLAEDEAPTVLTPEQVAIVRRGQADIKAGRFFTSEQVAEHFARKSAAWTQTDPA